MKTDLGSSFIGVVIVLLIAIPLFLIWLQRHRVKSKLLKGLHKLALEKNCSIDTHEVFTNFTIGLDSKKGYLFFYKEDSEKINEQILHLSEVEKLDLVRIEKTIRNKEGRSNIIERLGLDFQTKNKKSSTVFFEFYNIDANLPFNNELQSLQNWESLLRKRLKHAA